MYFYARVYIDKDIVYVWKYEGKQTDDGLHFLITGNGLRKTTKELVWIAQMSSKSTIQLLTTTTQRCLKISLREIMIYCLI